MCVNYFMFKIDIYSRVSVNQPVIIWYDRSDDSEIDDDTIDKILIVTQTPPAFRRHPQGDRTGDFLPRSKMSAELAKVINDGLYFYEQELFEEDEKVCVQVTRMVKSVLPFCLCSIY